MVTKIVIYNFKDRSAICYENDNMSYPIAEIKDDNLIINKRTNRKLIKLVTNFIIELGLGLIKIKLKNEK